MNQTVSANVSANVSERLVQYVLLVESKAKTRKGQIKAVLAAVRSGRKGILHKALGISHKPKAVIFGHPKTDHRAAVHTPIQRDVRRAADDAEYRKMRLEQTNWHRGSFDLLLKEIETRKERQEFRTLLGKMSQRKIHITHLPTWADTIGIDPDTAEQVGAKVVKRGKDWKVRASSDPTRFEHQDGETQWNNGRPRTISRAVNTTHVRSLAYISKDGTACEFIIHNTRGKLLAPEGCLWGIDSNGLRLVRTADQADIHPDARQLLHGIDNIVEPLEYNARVREENRIKEEEDKQIANLVSRADEIGVMVCLADSLRAGNCRAGSEQFAHNHGLDPRKHYPPAKILEHSNGSTDRARLAIIAAVRRHLREERQGFAVLAEHYA